MDETRINKLKEGFILAPVKDCPECGLTHIKYRVPCVEGEIKKLTTSYPDGSICNELPDDRRLLVGQCPYTKGVITLKVYDVLSPQQALRILDEMLKEK